MTFPHLSIRRCCVYQRILVSTTPLESSPVVPWTSWSSVRNTTVSLPAWQSCCVIYRTNWLSNNTCTGFESSRQLVCIALLALKLRSGTIVHYDAWLAPALGNVTVIHQDILNSGIVSFWSWFTMAWMALTGQSLTLVRKILLANSLLHTRAAQYVDSVSSTPSTMSGLLSDSRFGMFQHVRTVKLHSFATVEQTAVSEGDVLQGLESDKLSASDQAIQNGVSANLFLVFEPGSRVGCIRTRAKFSRSGLV
jgi:hypothetical protein